MVIGLVVLITVGIIVSTSCTRTQRQNATEEAATEYARKLFKNKEVGIACSTDDSDGDGYVSCDLMVDGKVHPIECTYSYIGRKTGCKSRLMMQVK
jgi:hypothetical protein